MKNIITILLISAILFVLSVTPIYAQTLSDVFIGTIPFAASAYQEDRQKFEETNEYILSLCESLPQELGVYLPIDDKTKLIMLRLQTMFATDQIVLDGLKNQVDEIANTYRQVKQQAEREAYVQQVGSNIANATYHTGSPGAGWCAAWVSRVYQNAGLGYPGGNADDMYYTYCASSNRQEIKQGMIIAVPTHACGGWAGIVYGHVGILVYHDNQWYVRHNIGNIAEDTLDNWIATYGTLATPKWGFAAQF